MPFDSQLREMLLLWCDRHCCLCKKACDVFIEVHHIIPEGDGGSDEAENAMPLCFDCHAKVSHYDHRQPLGTKFKPSELKRRREQVYDEFTRHLVPSVTYKATQSRHALPTIGFSVQHEGDGPQVRLRVRADVYIDGVITNHPGAGPFYTGEMDWHLNRKMGVHGNFPAVDVVTDKGRDLVLGIHMTVIDCHERPHELLPVAFAYDRASKDWWLDLCDPAESARIRRRRRKRARRSVRD